ncbi:hypothetical protein [Olleya namhaensis]|uniref:Lipoprotein n=1 Tax=Olleya namhaensis TaxID=1144750 RepID=A0A1I3JXN3_9FLAO|nr:hypothetical protein [Olleya namhaensis]SFI64934.1 hypothetical protein SAMN05443431_101598 [Olleya namhaensis]
MRLFFALCFFTLFFSCNNEKKHYGDWTYDWSTSITEDGDVPSRVKISKDSIKFRYLYFDYWSSFPVKFSNNKLEFNGLKFKTKFDKDTLIFNKHFRVFKTNDTIVNSEFLREDNFVSINLPKIDSDFTKYKISNITYIIKYGQRRDNKQYSLNLNDKYSNFKDLKRFLHDHHEKHDYKSSILLFCDKNAKMLEIEKMLCWFQYMNKLKIALVNNININFDKHEPFYSYETLNLKLPPEIENDKYFSKITSNLAPPPPPFSLIKESNILILKLNKNKIFNNKKELDISELKALIEKSIRGDKLIISLYDLDSDYNSFMKMNATINLCYKNIRNENVLLKHKKAFDELNIEEQNSIKKEIPNKSIWNYSIPHFNSLIEENGNFLGLNINTIN